MIRFSQTEAAYPFTCCELGKIFFALCFGAEFLQQYTPFVEVQGKQNLLIGAMLLTLKSLTDQVT